MTEAQAWREMAQLTANGQSGVIVIGDQATTVRFAQRAHSFMEGGENVYDDEAHWRMAGSIAALWLALEAEEDA